MEVEAYSLLVGAKPRVEDRVAIFEQPDGLTLVVADGAGGVSGAAEAAQLVLDGVEAFLADGQDPRSASGWSQLLMEIDERVLAAPEAGESTAVVVHLSSDGLVGASVGDSEAWLLERDTLRVLTENQRRKRIGMGSIWAEPFEAAPLHGDLLLGSDGLFRYLTREDILPLLEPSDGETCLQALETALLARFEKLPDDLGLVLARGEI